MPLRMPREAPPEEPPESEPAAAGDQTHRDGAHQETAQSEDPDVDDAALVAAWLSHLEQKEIARALPKVLTSLERATRTPEQVQLPAAALLELLATLAASGDAIRAKQLTEALRRWVWVMPKGALPAAEFAHWVLLDELARIEPHLPHPLYQTFGRLLESGDPELLDALSKFQHPDPNHAKRDREWLAAVAPALFRTFGRFLAPNEALTPHQRRSANGWLALVGLIILLNLLRMFHESKAKDRSLPEGTAAGSWGKLEVRADDRTTHAETITSERDRLLGWLRHTGEGHRAEAAAEALLHGSCADASDALSMLEASVRAVGGDTDESMRRLWTEYARKCSGMQHSK